MRQHSPAVAGVGRNGPSGVAPGDSFPISRVCPPSVRQQLTERYVALTAAIEKTIVPDAELGAAYGEIGSCSWQPNSPAEAEAVAI